MARPFHSYDDFKSVAIEFLRNPRSRSTADIVENSDAGNIDDDDDDDDCGIPPADEGIIPSLAARLAEALAPENVDNDLDFQMPAGVPVDSSSDVEDDEPPPDPSLISFSTMLRQMSIDQVLASAVLCLRGVKPRTSNSRVDSQQKTKQLHARWCPQKPRACAKGPLSTGRLFPQGADMYLTLSVHDKCGNKWRVIESLPHPTPTRPERKGKRGQVLKQLSAGMVHAMRVRPAGLQSTAVERCDPLCIIVLPVEKIVSIGAMMEFDLE